MKMIINLQDKTNKIVKILEDKYPEQVCGLHADNNPFKLLIMAILSAQTTDARVNLISPVLFEKFPDAKSIAESDDGELEEYIKSVGLYNTKAKNIRKTCKRLVEVYNNIVPSSMDDLLTLSGVGRKVANLIRGDVFNLGGIVTDTHCIRISNRLGLVNTKNPIHIEKSLNKLVPIEKQTDFCHRIVTFGREVCNAKKPDCNNCFLYELCDRNNV